MSDNIIGQTGHVLFIGKSGQYQGPLANHLASEGLKRGQHVFVLCDSEAEATSVRRIMILAQRLEPSRDLTRWHIVSGFQRHSSAVIIEPLIDREMVDSKIGEAIIFRDLSHELIPIQPDDIALQSQHALACYGQSLTAISICGPSSPLPDFAPYAEHADSVWICSDTGSEVSLAGVKPQQPSTIHRFQKRTANGLVIFEKELEHV